MKPRSYSVDLDRMYKSRATVIVEARTKAEARDTAFSMAMNDDPSLTWGPVTPTGYTYFGLITRVTPGDDTEEHG
jgi:hypothetical protein